MGDRFGHKITTCKKVHPEQLDGEVFMGNTTFREFFKSFGYVHKRLGKIAYDIHNEVIPGHQPVFVQKSEMDEAGALWDEDGYLADWDDTKRRSYNERHMPKM